MRTSKTEMWTKQRVVGVHRVCLPISRRHREAYPFEPIRKQRRRDGHLFDRVTCWRPLFADLAPLATTRYIGRQLFHIATLMPSDESGAK